MTQVFRLIVFWKEKGCGQIGQQNSTNNFLTFEFNFWLFKECNQTIFHILITYQNILYKDIKNKIIKYVYIRMKIITNKMIVFTIIHPNTYSFRKYISTSRFDILVFYPQFSISQLTSSILGCPWQHHLLPTSLACSWPHLTKPWPWLFCITNQPFYILYLIYLYNIT